MRFIWITALLVACSAPKEDETLKKAASIHEVAVKKAHDVSLKVSELKRGEDLLSPPQKDSLQFIITSLSEWYENLVEVPGYDHDDHDHSGHDHGEHDHDHDHDHDHGNEMKYLESLSSEEILSIQQELKLEIERIEGRIAVLARNAQGGE